MSVKIEEFLKSLPNNIISGDDVHLPEDSLRSIFKFLNLNEKDIFYHLGCGDGKGIVIALEEFNVKNLSFRKDFFIWLIVDLQL